MEINNRLLTSYASNRDAIIAKTCKVNDSISISSALTVLTSYSQGMSEELINQTLANNIAAQRKLTFLSAQPKILLAILNDQIFHLQINDIVYTLLLVRLISPGKMALLILDSISENIKLMSSKAQNKKLREVLT